MFTTFKNDGKGNFTKGQELNLIGYHGGAMGMPRMEAVDWSGDGFLDIEATVLGFGTNQSGAHVYVNDGTGMFSVPPDGSSKPPAVIGGYWCEPVDLTNDGLADAGCLSTADPPRPPSSSRRRCRAQFFGQPFEQAHAIFWVDGARFRRRLLRDKTSRLQLHAHEPLQFPKLLFGQLHDSHRHEFTHQLAGSGRLPKANATPRALGIDWMKWLASIVNEVTG